MKRMKLRPSYRWGIVWFSLLVICALVWWSVRNSRPSLASMEELPIPSGHEIRYKSISLERTACYGDCPVYTVTLHRDGRAEYKPRAHLPQKGDFQGNVSPRAFERLSYLLEQNGFDEMKERYAALHTDAATCIVTASSTWSTKKVSDYGEVGPIDLWAIQEVIDGIRERTDWKPVPIGSP